MAQVGQAVADYSGLEWISQLEAPSRAVATTRCMDLPRCGWYTRGRKATRHGRSPGGDRFGDLSAGNDERFRAVLRIDYSSTDGRATRPIGTVHCEADQPEKAGNQWTDSTSSPIERGRC